MDKPVMRKIFLLVLVGFLPTACTSFLFPRSQDRKSMPRLVVAKKNSAKSAKSATVPAVQSIELSSDSYRIFVGYPSKLYANEGFSVRIQDRLSGRKRRVHDLSPEVKVDNLRQPAELSVPPRGPVFEVKMAHGGQCDESTYHLFILGMVDPSTGAPLRESVTFSIAPFCENGQ